MKKTLCYVILLCFYCGLQAQQFNPLIAQFKVSTGEFRRENTPMKVDVTDLQIQRPGHVILYESVNGKKVEVPCQIHVGTERSYLYFLLSGTTESNKKRLYQLEYTRRSKGEVRVKAVANKDLVTLNVDGKECLTYHNQTVMPPVGYDEAYKKSGFIHPAKSPSGKVVTTIQPADHIHHYGFFNPWTRIEYDGKEYDLWNVMDKQGNVEFDRFLSMTQGDACAGFVVNHANNIFRPEKRRVMDEVVDVKAWDNAGSNFFMWDFISSYTAATDLPVTFPQYRYGGFCLRATEQWNGDNCEVLTSTGTTRDNTDSTKAAWIYVKGLIDGAPVSVLIMDNPGNINHPQPLRIWNSKQNKGKANVMINYCASKMGAWVLNPGDKRDFAYRIVVMDESITKEQAERFWIDYSTPPTCEVQSLADEKKFPIQYENKGSFLIIDYFHPHYQETPTLKTDQL